MAGVIISVRPVQNSRSLPDGTTKEPSACNLTAYFSVFSKNEFYTNIIEILMPID